MRVGYIKGLIAVPFAYLATDSENFELFEYKDCNALYAALIKKDIDVSTLPLNVAIKAFEKSGGQIVSLCLTQTTSFYLVGKGASNLSVLVGKKAISYGGYLTRGFIDWILKKSNIPYELETETSDMTSKMIFNFDYQEAKDKVFRAVSSGDFAFIMEPVATSCVKVQKVYRLIDLQDTYINITGTRALPLAACVGNKEFCQSNYDKLLVFIQKVESCITNIHRYPAAVATLIRNNNLGVNASIALEVLQYANYDYKAMKQCVESVKEYIDIYNKGVLLAASEKSLDKSTESVDGNNSDLNSTLDKSVSSLSVPEKAFYFY